MLSFVDVVAPTPSGEVTPELRGIVITHYLTILRYLPFNPKY